MQNPSLYEQASEAAQFIAGRTPLRPTIGLVLGSGLGGVASRLETPFAIPYEDIPYFPCSTAPGHSGRLVVGTIDGTPVAVLQGRVHGYEGYSSGHVAFPTRVLGRFGIRTLILTNAAGGIRTSFHEGQLVLISDHINLTGQNSAMGPNDERFGLRFFDMGDAYSRRLRTLAHAAAKTEGLTLEEGIYLSVPGPSYETPAEIRAFRTLGADLVGMSTVLETIFARFLGMGVVGFSMITNTAGAEDTNHADVVTVGIETGGRLADLIEDFLQNI